MSAAGDCAGGYWWHESLAWVHVLPTLFTLAIYLGGVAYDPRRKRWGRQILLVIYGLYLHVWQYALVVFAQTLRMGVEAPAACRALTFPVQLVFYVVCVIVFTVSLSYLYGWPLSVFWWLCIYLVLGVGAGLLLWVDLYWWWELLFNAGLALVATGAYNTVFYFYLRDMVPYLLLQPPFTWMNCVDTWVLEEEHWRVYEKLCRLEPFG